VQIYKGFVLEYFHKISIMTSVTLKNVKEAYERLRSHIHRTPVMTSSSINKMVGKKVYFKCENFQKTGTFKARGALNAVLAMNANNPEGLPGVVTYSCGNHALALAWAANMANIPCTVVLTNTSSPLKRQIIRSFGAEVVLCEPTPTARVETCYAIAKERGWVVVPTADHPDVIAGQGTLTLEFLEQVPQLDVIISPVSGGGLLAGACVAAKEMKPDVRLYAVEPCGKELEKSLRAGKPLWTGPPVFMNHTIADGMRLQACAKQPFSIMVEHAEKTVFSVENDEISDAMRLIWERLKVVIEPSAASPVAALLSPKFQEVCADVENIGILLEGGNTDLNHLPWINKES
jgi:serine racemase